MTVVLITVVIAVAGASIAVAGASIAVAGASIAVASTGEPRENSNERSNSRRD